MESHKYIGLYKYKVSLKITMNYEIFRMVDLWDSYSELGDLHFHNIPMLCLMIQNYVDVLYLRMIDWACRDRSLGKVLATQV